MKDSYNGYTIDIKGFDEDHSDIFDYEEKDKDTYTEHTYECIRHTVPNNEYDYDYGQSCRNLIAVLLFLIVVGIIFNIYLDRRHSKYK